MPKLTVKAQFANIRKLHCGTNNGILCGIIADALVVLVNERLKKRMCNCLQVIQTTKKSIITRMTTKKQDIPITAKFPIKGLDCSENHVLFWSGNEAKVYEVNSDPKLKGSFECKAMFLAIIEDNVIICKDRKIDVCN